MMRIFWFCVLLSSAYAISIESTFVQKRVIGGNDVQQHDYPWAASIKAINPKTKSVTYCGATVIADKWLLTAAHCFWAGTKEKTHLMKPESWRIQAGSFDIELGTKGVSHEESIDQSSFQNILEIIKEIYNILSEWWKNRNNSTESKESGSFAESFFKFSNSTKKKTKIVKARAAKIILHPKYKPDDLEYDIALVKLTKQLTFNKEHITLAKLPTADQPEIWPPVRSRCTFVGWGCKKANGGPSSTAQVVALRVLPNEDCSELYNHGAGLNDEHEFCAGFYKSNVGICAGDSGSGLIYLHDRQPVVVGVASATHGQYPADYPGLFTRVASFVDWITKTIEEEK